MLSSSTMEKFPSCIFLLLLTLTTHNLIIPSLSLKCNPAEKEALLKIKKELGSPTKLSSWNPTTDCCRHKWEGVPCDSQTYRVNKLDLFDLNLPKHVEIPPSIFTNLPFINFLSIDNIPNLVGTIPPSISKLEVLIISGTSISGEIPNSLSQIKTLTSILLTDNKLTGTIPATLSSLPDVFSIYFNGNQLTGTIPESYGSLPKSFMCFGLAENRLTGKIPTSLANLNLVLVNLSGNALEGDASVLFGSKKRTVELSLDKNMLSFDIGKVGLPKNLTLLNLSKNKIYGALPKGLTKLKVLSDFNVSYNRRKIVKL